MLISLVCVQSVGCMTNVANPYPDKQINLINIGTDNIHDDIEMSPLITQCSNNCWFLIIIIIIIIIIMVDSFVSKDKNTYHVCYIMYK